MPWTEDDKKILQDALSSPFKYFKTRSQRSISRELSCYDPDTLIQRITPQIIEVLTNNLGWETPDEWDRSFTILGGGQGRRTSSAILKVFTWSQFISKVNEIRLINNL